MRTGFVYFIQAKSGPIKIGHTDDPQRRFQQFTIGHYEELTFLGVIPGTLEDEKRIQRSVVNSHIRGEWFNPTDEVFVLVATSVPPPAGKLAPPSQRIAAPQEREPIERALAAANTDITKAARMLGCSRRTLQNRMRGLGIPIGKSGRKRKIVGED